MSKKRVQVRVEVDVEELTMELARTVEPDALLRLIRDIDGLVAEEEFTLKLAKWARHEEDQILADRLARGAS